MMNKTQISKQKRIRWMGWTFFTLAILLSAYAFFTTGRYSDKEGYYMISGIFLVMGLYCFK